MQDPVKNPNYIRKILKIIGYTIAAVVIIALTYVGIYFPPVMVGMASKTMCSCVFVAGRTPESVREMELKVFPGLSSADFVINKRDSTIDASLLFTTRRSIYRKRLGCVLITDAPEDKLRHLAVDLPASAPDKTLTPWPDGDVITRGQSTGVNTTLIDEAVADAFRDTDPSKPKNTLAMVVLHDGQMIAERYADGFNYNSRMAGWSMTKSVTNALVGILVGQGKLAVGKAAPVEEWQQDDRREIQLDNLLKANAGLDWSESYFVPTSSFHKMFMLSDDKGAYAISRKLENTPGMMWKYSSGTTNILSKIIRRTAGDSVYYKLPYEQLFYKIGMNHALIETDAAGGFVGSSYCFATARDWARFGLLFLNDGVWHDERILPEGWVKYSTTPSPAALMGQYGAQWWLNAGSPKDHDNRKYPTLPVDAYWADGFEEQWVMIVPSRKLVVVRLGVSHHGADFIRVMEKVIQAVDDNE